MSPLVMVYPISESTFRAHMNPLEPGFTARERVTGLEEHPSKTNTAIEATNFIAVAMDSVLDVEAVDWDRDSVADWDRGSVADWDRGSVADWDWDSVDLVLDSACLTFLTGDCCYRL
ncbi:hypothetical protein [Candidatus Palauibacter sp.]|uniref:hypothetical protein n=1 Tax=Candidatus Palauibacter sp. TaxID=3101350 RepID=UPI003C6ECF2F